MVNELARSRPAEVLLVEDNENDALLTRKGFERAKLMVNLHHVRDGEEYADAPTPDMVLLDLNMPKMDGYEVLSQIVQDECLRHLPEVILTTSAEEREILDMYRLRCSSYIVKPVDFYQFLGAIRMIGDYWFTVVVLPTDTQPRDRG
jgi:two-component system, chemotaxis family, response regulator Rcp1